MSKLLLIPLVAFAWLSHAQTTTIEVPQGSGVLPTVGQVNCLEELGSGRLCAATYECSEGSGRLWGDMANHDGRRAIGKDSPVARGRDCTITVDGSAAVRWLTAYSPGGRTGELVGLTTSGEALRPVVRRGSTGSTSEDGGRLLDYIFERYDTTLAEYADARCSHIRRGHEQYDICVEDVLWGTISMMDVPNNAFTRCMVEAVERIYCPEQDCTLGEFLFDRSVVIFTVETTVRRIGGYENYRKCLPLAQDILAEYGVEFYEYDDDRFKVRYRE